MDYLICKGCNTKVAKPVLCASCGIASHPGCLNRTGHPVLNGKFSDCSLASSSSIPHNPNDSQLINNFRLFKQEIEEALTERFNVFEKKILDFINNLRSEINSEIDGIKKREIYPPGVSFIKTFRLGAAQQDRTRPLKIICNSREDVLNILRNKAKYKGPAIINEDRTPKQRAYLQELRNELNNLHASGDLNKTIRFINGTPKIISSNRSNYSSQKN
ncbi:hypothetical protein KPH14_003658 [Odynerus spinipes]|uniref:Uncharacterized protein n=1 Tax=Odynerus spinipes TaxID=1348599 RepID=A0AAD9REW6_9HYME|nr:hypothetical protein KPH14_003658 [Odynerus spinipes]